MGVSTRRMSGNLASVYDWRTGFSSAGADSSSSRPTAPTRATAAVGHSWRTTGDVLTPKIRARVRRGLSKMAAPPSKPPSAELESKHSNTDSVSALVSDLAAIIAETDRLAQIEDSDRLTREAVEFARNSLGIERVCIYLVESSEPQVVLRGTWGTSNSGLTTDERGLAHTYSREDFEFLRGLHARGELWDHCLLESRDNDRRCLPWTREDRGWLATTPLVSGREVLGVFYNDTAISRAALDPTKQAKLATFGSLLAGLTRDRLGQQRGAVPKTSRFIHKVLYAGRPDSGPERARRGGDWLS